MPILTGSRYENSTVDFFTKKEYGTSYPVVFYTPDSLVNISFLNHVVTEGETLHGLSQVYFSRPDLWWAIVEYNPEIVDFINITPGTVIRIPSV